MVTIRIPEGFCLQKKGLDNLGLKTQVEKYRQESSYKG